MKISNSSTHLILHYEATYLELPVQNQFSPLITQYMDGILEVLHKAVLEHPRTYCLRVDLKYPLGISFDNSNVMSRFIESLKSQINADLNQKEREGTRIYPCSVRYVWVREKDSSINHHYHVLLLFNKDTYHTLGNLKASDGNLGARVRKAWASALGLPIENSIGGVHFPKNCGYYLHWNLPTFKMELKAVFRRVSYLTKLRTKDFSDGKRNFGCSCK